VISTEVGESTKGALYLTEQLPFTRVQSTVEKDPLLAVKCTVPLGTMAPPISESVTVAVQVVLERETIGDGKHTTETVTDL
jgi:hypothetical protein